jgi:hypothetical protein
MSWQAGPQDDGIQMAGVIGKVDTLARIGLAVHPPHGRTGKQLGEQRQYMRGQVHPETTLQAGREKAGALPAGSNISKLPILRWTSRQPNREHTDIYWPWPPRDNVSECDEKTRITIWGNPTRIVIAHFFAVHGRLHVY